MSFGWSAGDVIAAIKLIHSAASSIQDTGGAREQFQELETELTGLERSLDGIAALTRIPNPLPEIEALKFVSVSCLDTLQRFHNKISPFAESLDKQSNKSKLRATPRMIRWQLLVRKDLPELRSYLVAHVGYLNLQLSTALLKSTSGTRKQIEDMRSQHEVATALITQRMDNASIVRQRIENQIMQIPVEDTLPTIKAVANAVDRVWNSNNDQAIMLKILMERVPPPDLRYTWAQAPVRFEDALGNVFPIPSEYDWEKMNAVILAHFSKSPGRNKVFAGEYELFEEAHGIHPLDPTKLPRLRPGMTITMAIVIGQYSGSERCPRIGCRARPRNFRVNELEGRAHICPVCGLWFMKSDKKLPAPLRPLAMSTMPLLPTTQEATARVRDRSPTNLDRRMYKNISIYVTELPATPPVLSMRKGKSYRPRERTWDRVRRFADNSALAKPALETHNRQSAGGYALNTAAARENGHQGEGPAAFLQGLSPYPPSGPRAAAPTIYPVPPDPPNERVRPPYIPQNHSIGYSTQLFPPNDPMMRASTQDHYSMPPLPPSDTMARASTHDHYSLPPMPPSPRTSRGYLYQNPYSMPPLPPSDLTTRAYSNQDYYYMPPLPPNDPTTRAYSNRDHYSMPPLPEVSSRLYNGTTYYNYDPYQFYSNFDGSPKHPPDPDRSPYPVPRVSPPLQPPAAPNAIEDRFKPPDLLTFEHVEKRKAVEKESKTEKLVEPCPAKRTVDDAPITFTDCVGRKFSFPWELCKTWQDMDDLIKQSFRRHGRYYLNSSRVLKGQYDVINTDGEIILPQTWDRTVKPGMTLRMKMWPYPEAAPFLLS